MQTPGFSTGRAREGKGGVELNFEGLEMQKWNFPADDKKTSGTVWANI